MFQTTSLTPQNKWIDPQTKSSHRREEILRNWDREFQTWDKHLALTWAIWNVYNLNRLMSDHEFPTYKHTGIYVWLIAALN